MKLCIFDFDSTLMDGETIEHFAKSVNKENEVAKITSMAMRGEIDFFESLQKRVALLKGTDLSFIQQTVQQLPYMPGAKDLIAYLKSKNIFTVVFSGGFYIATHYAQQILGFDISFANKLHHKYGKLTGHVGGEMMFSDSKGIMLQKIKQIMGINQNEVMCIGDGANDISMFEESGLKIAFMAKEILKSKADICIDVKNLNEVKKYV